MAVSVYGPDTFTVGSDIALQTYDSDWQKTNTAGGVNIIAEASTDHLRTTSGNNPAYRWNGETLVDQSIKADIHTAGSGVSWPGLTVRWSATFAGYLAEWDPQLDGIVIYDAANSSSFTTLAQGGAVDANTTYTGAYLKIVGDQIEAGDDVNGQAAVTTDDATHTTGQPGISIACDTGQVPWIDNVEIFDETATGSTPYVAELSAPAFAFTAQALTRFNDWAAALSAPLFKWTANAINMKVNWVAQLSTPAFKFTANALTRFNEWTAALTAPAFKFTAQALELVEGQLIALSTAAFNFTGQALTRFNEYIVALSAPAFRFSARALTLVDLVSETIKTYGSLAGRHIRRAMRRGR